MKLSRQAFFFVLFIAFSNGVSAQKIITTYHKDSTYILTRDERIDQLVTRQKDNNTVKQSISGYRVQIYFGSSRLKATEVKGEFSDRHSDVLSYLSYSAPNFKVRVGDFRTRLEAIKFMKSIENQYPTVFVIPDDIKLPPLK